jgi:plastocyanin
LSARIDDVRNTVMRTSFFLSSALALVAVSFLACGDDDQDGTGGATTSTTTSGATTTSGGQGGDGQGGQGTGGDGTGGDGTGGDGTGGDGTGGDGTGGDGTGGGTGGAGGASAVAIVPCQGATIAAEITTQGAVAFLPEDTTIDAGETVRFSPIVNHNMTSDDGLFATPTGQITCLQFNQAGDYPFFCSVHPNMTGTVIVD